MLKVCKNICTLVDKASDRLRNIYTGAFKDGSARFQAWNSQQSCLKCIDMHMLHIIKWAVCWVCPHHFVWVTLEADDAAPVASLIGTELAAAVLQLQDAPVPRGTGLHLAQIHILISNLHTGCRTGGTLPWTWQSSLSRGWFLRNGLLILSIESSIQRRIQVSALTSHLNQRPADVDVETLPTVVCRGLHLPVPGVQGQRGEVVRVTLTITEKHRIWKWKF